MDGCCRAEVVERIIFVKEKKTFSMRMMFNFSVLSPFIYALGLTNSKLPPSVSRSYVLIMFKKQEGHLNTKGSRKFL